MSEPVKRYVSYYPDEATGRQVMVGTVDEVAYDALHAAAKAVVEAKAEFDKERDWSEYDYEEYVKAKHELAIVFNDAIAALRERCGS